MAKQDSERLRQLVGDYYHGLITPESYREQRAELLENIGAEINDPADTITKRPKPPQKESASTPEPADSAIPVSSFRPKRFVIGAIVIAGVAAGAYAVFILGPGSGLQPGSTAMPGDVVEERSSFFGDAIVEEFLNRNDWMEDSLNNFLLAWGALDDGQRQQATKGRPYRRLATALHQRIREETALGGTSEGGRLETLVSFATTIGSPYRESRAPRGDQNMGTEVPPADVLDEPEALPTDSNFGAADSSDPETAAPETSEPTTAPVSDANQPADDLVPEPESESAVTAEARELVDDPCPADIANTRQPYCQDTLTDGSMGPPLVVLQTGTFEMGSASVETEAPPHQVEIAYHIAFSRYEISSQEYEQFCAATSLPCEDQPWDDDSPVVSVSWDDAVLYAQWLSDTTGFQYRLPSEAEWEFAARAGTQSPYFFGDEITPSAAHSSDNGPVDAPLSRTDRKINRNPFRLHHMSGNVREWTQDAWYPNYDNAPGDGSARELEMEDRRTVRGGSYSDAGIKLRSAAREPLERNHRDAQTGFRVVRKVLQQVADK